MITRGSATKNLHNLLNLAPYSKADRDRFDNGAVRRLVGRYPFAASERYDFTAVGGGSPLHPIFMAVSLGASLDVVELLHNAFPPALKEKDRYDRTPLHQACEFRADVDVVELLLDRNPAGGVGKDYVGRTPLHCACAYEAHVDVVRLLADRHPGALAEKDRRGRTPLHIACGLEAPLAVVRLLVERHSAALIVKDNKGSTPLELVEKGNASLEVLASLTAVHALLHQNPKLETVKSVLARFGTMMWGWGVTRVLEAYPCVVHGLSLDDKMMPDLLFMVGRDCQMQTMFEIARGMPGMFEDERA